MEAQTQITMVGGRDAHPTLGMPHGRGHEARSLDLSCLFLNLHRLGVWQGLCLSLSYSTSLAKLFFFFFRRISKPVMQRSHREVMAEVKVAGHTV